MLQLPALLLLIISLLALRHWSVIPSWVFWAGTAVWIVKDVLLFPFVWRAYDPDAPSAANAMVGRRGVAVQRLEPSGYIQVGGELWNAELEAGETTVEAGETVLVQEVRGLTLQVRRERDARGGTERTNHSLTS